MTTQLKNYKKKYIVATIRQSKLNDKLLKIETLDKTSTIV